MVAYSLLLVFPALMILAALNDVGSMTIPNWISAALFGTFVVLAAVCGMGWGPFGLHLLAGFGLLAAGIVLFATGTFGGGDAKLIAAGGFWIGPDLVVQYIAYIAVFGGVLALSILAYRRMIPATSLPLPAWALRLYAKDGGIPYGVAIAAGALLTFPKTQLYVLAAGG
ncbi:MAG: prepilin peptidase [Hyphomicrobiaceae bacterium]|nr:prepilin peptidase [Hyphomicrobiaceae bacterium]